MIREYQNTDKTICLELFMTNNDKFFAESELQEFDDFLDSINRELPYFVMFEQDELVACGGFYVKNNVAHLTWGMVKRVLHRKGFGSKLVDYRINKIYHDFGEIPIEIETSQHTEKFYQLKGFKIQEVIKDGFAAGLDIYKMVK